ncbi:ABC transporter permease [Aestuariibacter halophilus]|uniref:ABC transporter permease n=1 Tax=Fluctibacter halophilus TaxID=226011 RepID=A0ABS8G5G8_9ALTE|nr:FtsX-like permease family protein [Aestuariibacter halophilus]MCC2615351.1 ABC transporter permease [Aestuariibacter halophilus]
MLEIGPIFRALMRNKVGAVLIAIQIAITMTIIVNSVFMIVERNEKMQRQSGLDEANTFHISSVGFGEGFNPRSTVEADLAQLRALPGVVDAIQINALPISGGGWSMGLQTEPGAEHDGTGVAVYMVDEHGINALDVEVIAGENFAPSDIRWRASRSPTWPNKVILTKAMVEKLFPDSPWADAVGKTVYINDNDPMIISGIIDKLQAPWVGWDNVENAMLSPERMEFTATRYLIRTQPGQRDRLMPEVEEMLASSNKQRVIRGMRTVEEDRERSYRGDSAMIKILTTVMVILTIVTALGIVGLASFSVNRRRKQIGTRRALGASQGAILRYFMLENFLISSVGVVLGAGLTIGLNILLVNTFEMNPMNWYYIPIGMLVLWLVGQVAVYGPARRAAGIAPATATRTV